MRLLREADHRLIIVGGGPAGLSAAIYAARAEMEPLVIARDGRRGARLSASSASSMNASSSALNVAAFG